jgi:hypothetical protein
MVSFEQRVPLGGITGHVEGGEEDFHRLRCLLDPKELVTPVKPWEGILQTIEDREKQLVVVPCSMGNGVTGVGQRGLARAGAAFLDYSVADFLGL